MTNWPLAKCAVNSNAFYLRKGLVFYQIGWNWLWRFMKNNQFAISVPLNNSHHYFSFFYEHRNQDAITPHTLTCQCSKSLLEGCENVLLCRICYFVVKEILMFFYLKMRVFFVLFLRQQNVYEQEEVSIIDGWQGLKYSSAKD